MMVSLPWRKLLCPFCFDRFRPSEAWFRCRNPNSTECPPEVDKAYSDHIGVPNRYLNKAFAPPSKAAWLSSAAHEAKCPHCHKPTTLRICPHCHVKLPSQMEYVDSKILAVIGGTASGKSHYIATMVKQLNSVIGPHLHIRVMAVGDATRKNYETYYHAPVYGQKLLLPQTQSAQANPVVREPLIYRLEFPRRGLSVSAANLVLFDAAGEDIQDENTLALYNRYIQHASGIIFLLNPKQIGAVCEKLAVPHDAGEMVQHTVDRVVEMLRNELGVKPGQSVRIPTAFVLSKSDILETAVQDGCSFLEDVPHVNHYDLCDFETVHEEIRSYLSSWGEDGLLTAAEQFSPSGFFAVSALGCDPDPKTMKIPRINPVRCGDPILWLLTQLGYLQPYHSR